MGFEPTTPTYVSEGAFPSFPEITKREKIVLDLCIKSEVHKLDLQEIGDELKEPFHL